ncbi:hypothetical protein [Pseudofrankia sp. DC12]|uniref:hypothetical protein n=1 Tax=Pseudofrankia sp. DC12 TaxID=683315 RepID=UPI000B214055|nr:hypothetical protein [Pseudofrankia sp. DC12]
MSTVGSLPYLGTTANGSSSRQWSQQPGALFAGIAGPAAPAQDTYRAHAALFLQRIHIWLERMTPSIPQVAQFIPPTVVAVELYRARRTQESLAHASSIAMSLQQVIAMNPALPPL